MIQSYRFKDWLEYLIRNRERIQETIYIKPKQRIRAAKPPYTLFKRIKKARGMKIGMKLDELKERLVSI